MVCANCGAVALRNVRAGVARAREELEALAGEPVAEITAKTVGDPGTRVVVGTEAALHHVRAPVGVVAFLDFDQELLAPRYRAAEQALGLLARAGDYEIKGVLSKSERQVNGALAMTLRERGLFHRAYHADDGE